MSQSEHFIVPLLQCALQTKHNVSPTAMAIIAIVFFGSLENKFWILSTDFIKVL